MLFRPLALTLTLILSVVITTVARGDAGGWPQFGGPNRNFTVDAKGLAAA